MYERKIPVDLSCPLRLTMSLIDSKWKSCILDELRNASMRPSELHKALPEATPRVLDLQLKELVDDGLVAKTILPRTAATFRIFHYRTWAIALAYPRCYDYMGGSESKTIR